MSNLFTELKRRNVFKVGLAYIVVSWLTIQVVSSLSPMLELPDIFGKMILVVLLIGLPIALLLAWAFELTPDGVKPTGEVDASESIANKTSRKIDFIIIGALVLIIGGLAFERLVLAPTDGVETPEAIADATTVTSIAVLPFVNMSSDTEQEYFTDGISEEILNVLVKINDLKVAGRTSSFAYKGKNQDLRKIGEELNVNHILEGSVRKSGTKIRITAQLIRSEDGFHLWSQTYDREMVDIFEIQDEISKAIADALAVSLGIGEGATLVTHRTKIPAAYEAYLKARQYYSARGDKLKDAVLSLSETLVYDPAFVPAWALLAKTYSVYPYHAVPETDESWDKYLPLAKVAADRALALDPNFSEALVALGNVYKEQHDYVMADKSYRKAIELAPRDADAHHQYGEIFIVIGHSKKALEETIIANEIDPGVPILMNNLARSYLIDKQYEKALPVLEQALAINPDLLSLYSNKLGALFNLRRFDELIEVIENAPLKWFTGFDREMFITDFREAVKETILTGSEARLKHLQLILFEYRDLKTYYNMDPLDAFDDYARNYNYGQSQIVVHITEDYWVDQRVKDFIHKMGIFKAWQSLGFPDFCKPVGDDDFECEAAK